jgi:ABC-2 type transport system permease protein
MTQIRHIAIKEFKDYFTSPIAYIVISIFLIVTGWFFFSTFFLYDRTSMQDFFLLLPTIFSFIIPAVTMKLLSEEMNVGSYEILLTMPVSFTDIAIGKFLGATFFIVTMLVPTLLYPVSISFLGDLDLGPIAGGYLGTILLGSTYCAIGLFASSLTRNQIVAFIIGAAICFLLTIMDRLLFFIPGAFASIIDYMGANSHFINISKGIIDTRDIIYFASVIFLSIFGTYLVMKEKN